MELLHLYDRFVVKKDNIELLQPLVNEIFNATDSLAVGSLEIDLLQLLGSKFSEKEIGDFRRGYYGILKAGRKCCNVSLVNRKRADYVFRGLEKIFSKIRENKHTPNEIKKNLFSLTDKLADCEMTWPQAIRIAIEELSDSRESPEDILLRYAKEMREEIIFLQIAKNHPQAEVEWHVMTRLRCYKHFPFGLDQHDSALDNNDSQWDKFIGKEHVLLEHTADVLIEGVYQRLKKRYVEGMGAGSEVTIFLQEILIRFLKNHPPLWQHEVEPEESEPDEWAITNLLECVATQDSTAYVINPRGVCYLLEAIGLIC